MQSLDKGGKKSFITSDKVEELGRTITETTTNVTTASPSNAITTTTDATAGGKCTVATLANMMVIATMLHLSIPYVHGNILTGDN